MATITLYAGKGNQMSGLLDNAKKSVNEYVHMLGSLKWNLLMVDSSICNVEDVMDSVNASTKMQEEKAESLETFRKEVEGFLADVVSIDQSVAEAINRSKAEFYDEHRYLKPDCEKSDWQRFKDRCKKAGEWCREHWKEMLITVTIVVGAALAIVAVVASGGLALVPLLTGLGLSASGAVGISTVVATVAVISTMGSSVLNIFDTWCDIDGSMFQIIQNVFNWASVISNGVYSIGYIYNGFNGISNDALKDFNKNRLVNVSRWGRPDLCSGDWVMKGGNTFWNYIRSGKFQKGLGNQYAPFSSGTMFSVPNGSLKWPVGDTFFDRGFWAIIKWLLGQRRYFP